MAKSKDPAERWWAMHGLANLKASDTAAMSVIENATKDSSGGVRVAAARALYVAGQKDKAYAVLTSALQDKSEYVRHAAINEIDEFGPAPENVRQAVRAMKGEKGYIPSVAQHLLAQ
jgi:HEAT repeat protein